MPDLWPWIAVNAGPVSSAVFVLLLGWLLSRLVARAIRNWLPYARARNVAPLLSQVARYGIMLFAVVTALTFLGIPSASIVTVVGAMGLAVALALQNTLSNVAAGIMLIWLKPVAVGEYVVGDGIQGVVVEIGLFGTRLRSTSGLYVFTNNNRLWNGPITNHSREPRRRVEINFTMSETVEVDKMRELLLGVAVKHDHVLAEPTPTVHLESLVGDKIVLQLRAWTPTPEYSETLRSLAERAKASLNHALARKGEKAEASLAADPHASTHASAPPDPAPPAEDAPRG